MQTLRKQAGYLGAGPRRVLSSVSLSQRNKLTAYLRRIGGTVGWWQPGIGLAPTDILNASSWANQMGIAGPLLQASGAAQPIVLSWSGANYAYLPAVASNTLTSPNQSVTGNQPITFDIALNDYTPAADVTLFDKTSGNNGFAVKWLTTDKIRLVVGDGVGLTNVDVVAASGFTDGTRHTATIAWADGVGATFSYDGVVSGSQVAAVKTLTNAAVVMTIGSTTSIGKVYRLQVGTLYDMNASLASETTTNAATFTGGAGETWTLNNSGATPAQIVGSPQLLANGVAHFMQTANFTLIQPTTAYVVAKAISRVTVDNYIIDGTALNSGVLQNYSNDTTLNAYAGLDVKDLTNWSMNVYHIATAVFNGTSGSVKINNNSAVTGNIGTNNMGGLTIFVGGDGSSAAGNYQLKEVILRNVADSAATQLLIIQKLAAIHGIAI